MSHSVTSPYLPGMKKLTRKSLTSAVLAAGLALALTGAGTLPASAQSCLGRVEMQEAISAGQVVSPYEAAARAGYDPANVIGFQLCDEGGRLVWRVQLLSPSGEAQNEVLPAQ